MDDLCVGVQGEFFDLPLPPDRMMRILMALSLISLAVACAQKDAGKGLAKLSGRAANPENLFTDDTPSESGMDSTYYIGYVDYFPETREFYTAVYYRDGHEYPDEDLLESKLDSVIALEADWGRERLPMKEAKKMLQLTGLDTLSVFNRRHELVCRCPLTRVEYLWNGLESYFIAVFRSDGKAFEQTEELYGMSGHFPLNERSLFTVEEVNDVVYNEFVRQKLNMSAAMQWDMRHYRIVPSETVYSVISSHETETDEVMSYLAFNEGNNVRILNQELNNFQFLNILPVPVHMNGKPLLLISAGYPSSDVLWDYLAAFDGTRYEAVDYNRIHFNDITPRWRGIFPAKATAHAVGR
jgi:hypothetical protein